MLAAIAIFSAKITHNYIDEKLWKKPLVINAYVTNTIELITYLC